MVTIGKENSEYTAQITPINGKVMAEIIFRKSEIGLHDQARNAWHLAMNKSFGSIWNSSPTEADYKDAHEWVEQQLSLLEKYGTVIVVRPKHIEWVEQKIKDLKK